MILCFSSSKQKSVILQMILLYIFMFIKLWRSTSNDSHIVLNWFRTNSMVANPRNWYWNLKSETDISRAAKKYNNITFIAENKHIKSNNEVKLLEITFYHKLTSTKHINNLCNTTSNRLRALTRPKKRLPEAYIMPNLKHCPFICNFCGKPENRSINKIHKRTLRLIYDTWGLLIKVIYTNLQINGLH